MEKIISYGVFGYCQITQYYYFVNFLRDERIDDDGTSEEKMTMLLQLGVLLRSNSKTI